MSFILAFKSFVKALKNPDLAKDFVDTLPKKLDQRLESSDPSHLRMLGLLQQSGRLIDFLKEDITNFSDDQIGGAVRQIHADCSKSLEELVTIRPLREEEEGTSIIVEKGYDPSLIKVIGKVVGEPPFKGKLIHKGWKAHKKSLPKKMGAHMNEILCPAEVEVN